MTLDVSAVSKEELQDKLHLLIEFFDALGVSRHLPALPDDIPTKIDFTNDV